MQVDLLFVPGCPNAAVLAGWLAEELAGRADVALALVEIADADEAGRRGMTGSPTLLVDGRDPFARPGTGPSVSCRLYPAADGTLAGLPDRGRIRAALADPDIPRT